MDLREFLHREVDVGPKGSGSPLRPLTDAANRQPVLKPQDFFLLLALAALGDEVMTYPELAAFSGLSMSEVHAALKHAAAPLNARIAPSADPPPVWPALEGSMRGVALMPLYPSAPAASQRSASLYENLALFDALRVGNARERRLANEAFEARL